MKRFRCRLKERAFVVDSLLRSLNQTKSEIEKNEYSRYILHLIHDLRNYFYEIAQQTVYALHCKADKNRMKAIDDIQHTALRGCPFLDESLYLYTNIYPNGLIFRPHSSRALSDAVKSAIPPLKRRKPDFSARFSSQSSSNSIQPHSSVRSMVLLVISTSCTFTFRRWPICSLRFLRLPMSE